MKPAVTAVASAAALSALILAAPAAAQEVEMRHAVARVVVIVENRADIGVEITPGRADLPAPRVMRRGDRVMIDGELGRNAIRNCNGGNADARQPGEGASVELRRGGRVSLADAPLIVLRTPREVDIEVDGAVFGSIGRGATDVDLGNAGCGNWTVANVDGGLSVSQAGSGDVRAGSSRSLGIDLAGSGNVSAGPTRDLEANIAGSGNINVARVDGPIEASIAGSGDVRVWAGEASRIEANIAGSGSVDFDGRAAGGEANIMGSGDVRVGAASGQIERNVMGSGRLTVGG